MLYAGAMGALDYVCIFTGGSIRGGTYVGALRAMEQLGVNNKCFVGSSVGAVMGVFYAAGYSTKELEDIFNEINFDLFKDINITFSKDFSISKGEFYLEWIREKIEKKFYGENYEKGKNAPVTFKDMKNDVIIITTDLYSTKVKTFSKEETPDYEVAKAVRISSSMPGLLKPISFNGHLLVDGDLCRSWPVWKIAPQLLKYDARILEFRLEGGRERYKIDSTTDYLNSVFTTFSNFAADHIISAYKDKDKFDYIRLDAGDVTITNFNLSLSKKQELYTSGYRTTMDFFTTELPAKRKSILPHYIEILKALKEIREYFIESKYIIAKNKLAELFVQISKARKVIDTTYYYDILEFYENFMTNLFMALGIVSILKHKQELLKNLDDIIVEINEKVEEIEIFTSAV